MTTPTFWQKKYFSNRSEKVFVIKKAKNTVPRTCVISNLNGKETVGTFYEKQLQKTSKNELRIEKVIKQRGDNATQADLKGATSIGTSTLASKTDLPRLKTRADNLNVDKLKTSADLSTLNTVANSDVVKKTVYNQLFTTVNAIYTEIPSTSRLVTKTQYDSDKLGLEKKIETVDKKRRNTKGLVIKTDYNKKITEIENKIPSATGLVTIATPNTKSTEIENKLLNITNLITKTALNTKATEIENKIYT